MGSTLASRIVSAPAVEDADLVHEAALASAARRDVRWPRRPLTPLVRALLWALRLYVIVMLAVVVVQLTRLGG